MSREKPEILMIAPLPPPVHGSAMMSAYIRDSVIVSDAVGMDWVNLSTSRRMDEIGKGSLSKLWRFSCSWLRTLRLLLTHRYDAAYIAITCRGTGFLKDAPFALLCRAFRLPLVLHQHNKGMSGYVHRPLYRGLLRRVYRNARVVLLSRNLYHDISAIVPADNVTVCPNGIPDESEGFRREFDDIPGRDLRILFLSNLMADKGVWTLLDSLSALKDEGLPFTCDFVGGETAEIPARTLESEIERRGLGECVRYLGKRYGRDKHELMRRCDVIVLPSVYDCFPLVLLEAMQFSMVPVAAPAGGVSDIIADGDDGILLDVVPGEDPATPASVVTESLTASLRRLVKDPELRRRLGQGARLKYENSFTLPHFERHMADILKRAAVTDNDRD